MALAKKTGDLGMGVFMLQSFSDAAFPALEGWDFWQSTLEEWLRLDLDRRDHIPLISRRTAFRAARAEDVTADLADVIGALADFEDRDMRVALREDLARVAFGAGDLELARAYLEAAHDLMPENESLFDGLARVALHQRDPERLRSLVVEARTSPTRHLRFMVSSIAYAEAALALAEGRQREALALYRNAAPMLEAAGNRLALAWIGLDVLAALPPDDPEVAPWLERSRELFGHVGARAWLARLDASVATAAARAAAGTTGTVAH